MEVLFDPRFYMVMLFVYGGIVIVTSTVNHLTVNNFIPRVLQHTFTLLGCAILQYFIFQHPDQVIIPVALWINFILALATSTLISYVFGTQRRKLLNKISTVLYEYATWFNEEGNYESEIKYSNSTVPHNDVIKYTGM